MAFSVESASGRFHSTQAKCSHLERPRQAPSEGRLKALRGSSPTAETRAAVVSSSGGDVGHKEVPNPRPFSLPSYKLLREVSLAAATRSVLGDLPTFLAVAVPPGFAAAPEGGC